MSFHGLQNRRDKRVQLRGQRSSLWGLQHQAVRKRPNLMCRNLPQEVIAPACESTFRVAVVTDAVAKGVAVDVVIFAKSARVVCHSFLSVVAWLSRPLVTSKLLATQDVFPASVLGI